jgi:hypothetical protein
MSSWPEPASFHDALPKTMKYCKLCEKQTPHQIRTGQAVLTAICIPCLRRAITRELGRD